MSWNRRNATAIAGQSSAGNIAIAVSEMVARANNHQANAQKLLLRVMLHEIVHTLGQGDDQIAAFAGQSVIITDRNERCLEVMNRELAAGHRKLGIFYGAAHFPDMEKRLIEQGFHRTKQEWLTAWDIPKAVAVP